MKRSSLLICVVATYGVCCSLSCIAPRCTISNKHLVNSEPKNKNYGLQELWEVSDAVFIAFATSTENIGLTHVFRYRYDNYPADCWKTQFKVLSTLKGEEPEKTITLYHYQFQNEEDYKKFGPLFATFNISENKQIEGAFGAGSSYTIFYLLYTKKIEKNGYVLATGQEYSAFSVFELVDNWATTYLMDTLKLDPTRRRDESETYPFYDISH